MRDDEVRVVFMVFEYDHPPNIKLFGGLVEFTSESQNAPQMSEAFRKQIADGIIIVSDRIKKGLEQPAPVSISDVNHVAAT